MGTPPRKHLPSTKSCQPILGISLTPCQPNPVLRLQICQPNLGNDKGSMRVASEWLNDRLMTGLCPGYVRVMSGLCLGYSRELTRRGRLYVDAFIRLLVVERVESLGVSVERSGEK